MPADPICRVFVQGVPCGYVPQGTTAKEKLADLFTHERDVHLPVPVAPGLAFIPEPIVVIANPDFAVKLVDE